MCHFNLYNDNSVVVRAEIDRSSLSCLVLQHHLPVMMLSRCPNHLASCSIPHRSPNLRHQCLQQCLVSLLHGFLQPSCFRQQLQTGDALWALLSLQKVQLQVSEGRFWARRGKAAAGWLQCGAADVVGDAISISSARVSAAPSACSQPLEEPVLLCLTALRHPSELLTWCKSASCR